MSWTNHRFILWTLDLSKCWSKVISTEPLSCSGEETWQHGNSLVNYMKLVEMDGLTGKVKFDKSGLRTDFTLDIVELKRHGLEKVGTWHDKDGIKFSRNFMKTYSQIVESLQNKTLVVTTVVVSVPLLSLTYTPHLVSVTSLQHGDRVEQKTGRQ